MEHLMEIASLASSRQRSLIVTAPNHLEQWFSTFFVLRDP